MRIIGLPALSRPTALALIFLVASVGLPPTLVAAQAQPAGDRASDIVDKVLEFMEKARGRVEERLARLSERGIPLPEIAAAKMSEGIALANEASELRQAGDIATAGQRALQAMQAFREALQLAEAAAGAAETAEEAAAGRAMALSAAITRVSLFLGKIEELAEKAEAGGLAVSNVEGLVNQSRSLVKVAEARLVGGDVEGAAQTLGEARRLAGQANAEIRRATAEERMELARSLIAQTANRLQRVENLLNGLLEGLPVPPMARERIASAFQLAFGALDEARSRLREAQEKIGRGQLGLAVQALDEVKDRIEKAFDEAGRGQPGLGEALEKIERLEARLGKLSELLAELRGRGLNVASLEADLNEAGAALETASSLLLAPEKLDEARRAIGQAESKLRLVAEGLERARKLGEAREEVKELQEKIALLLAKIDAIEAKGLGLAQLRAALSQAADIVEAAVGRAAENLRFAERMVRMAERLVERAEDRLADVEGFADEGLATVASLKSKVRELSERLDELEAEGVDVARLRELLNEAAERIREAEERLGNPRAAGRLLTNAERLVEAVQDGVEELLEELAEGEEG